MVRAAEGRSPCHIRRVCLVMSMSLNIGTFAVPKRSDYAAHYLRQGRAGNGGPGLELHRFRVHLDGCVLLGSVSAAHTARHNAPGVLQGRW